jgi:hypothetical protein
MAYEIHIERIADDGSPTDPPLSLDEWKTAVNATDRVRLVSSAESVTNPTTGEVITIGASEGNAEMLVDEQWIPVFRWSNSLVSFEGLPSFDDPNAPCRQSPCTRRRR